VPGSASGCIFRFGGVSLGFSLTRSPNDTLKNIRHSATSIRPEYFDSNNVGLLSDAVFAGSDSASAMCSMTVAILVHIIRNGLAPNCTTLEFNMVDIDTGIDDVDINALSAVRVVFILCESTESQLGTMTDTSKTLFRQTSLGEGLSLRREYTYPWRRALSLLCANNLILLYKHNFRQSPYLFNDLFRKAARVTGDVAIIDMVDSSQLIAH